jgi:hypothetical protein
MNSEILKKNWEPEEIRKSQLNDNKLNSYTTVGVQKPLTLPEHPSTPQVLFRFVLLDL